MRNIILKSASAKYHCILPFFYKINKGDLPYRDRGGGGGGAARAAAPPLFCAPAPTFCTKKIIEIKKKT